MPLWRAGRGPSTGRVYLATGGTRYKCALVGMEGMLVTRASVAPAPAEAAPVLLSRGPRALGSCSSQAQEASPGETQAGICGNSVLPLPGLSSGWVGSRLAGQPGWGVRARALWSGCELWGRYGSHTSSWEDAVRRGGRALSGAAHEPCVHRKQPLL